MCRAEREVRRVRENAIYTTQLGWFSLVWSQCIVVDIVGSGSTTTTTTTSLATKPASWEREREARFNLVEERREANTRTDTRARGSNGATVTHAQTNGGPGLEVAAHNYLQSSRNTPFQMGASNRCSRTNEWSSLHQLSIPLAQGRVLRQKLSQSRHAERGDPIDYVHSGKGSESFYFLLCSARYMRESLLLLLLQRVSEIEWVGVEENWLVN